MNQDEPVWLTDHHRTYHEADTTSESDDRRGTYDSVRYVLETLRSFRVVSQGSDLLLTLKNGSPGLLQIGDLDGVINSIGPYITGDFIDPDDVTGQKEIVDNGRKVRISLPSHMSIYMRRENCTTIVTKHSLHLFFCSTSLVIQEESSLGPRHTPSCVSLMWLYGDRLICHR